MPTWPTLPLKRLLVEPLAYGANEAGEFDNREWPRFVRITDVGPDGNLRDETFKSLPEDVARPYLLKEGDVLLARSGATVGKAFFYQSSWGRACFAGYLIRARVDTRRILSPFLHYYVQSRPYDEDVSLSTFQATIQNVSAERYGAFRVPVPRLDAQKAVVRFLDRKTAVIDDLILKKERLIELLQEKRQALITQAVTKGLAPNVPMKDSGIEWIGQIPRHWKVQKVKHVARLESGHTPSRSVAEHWLDSNDIPWVSLNDTKQLSQTDYISDTALHINELGLQNSSARMLPAGIVVFTRDATIGKAAITTRPMAVSQHIIAWVCGSTVRPEYLLRVFYAMEWYLDRFTFGATIKTIGMDDVNTLVTPVPPLDEQERIARRVTEDCAHVDRLIRLVEEQAEKIREYRQALITAAVTGQLDIPAEAA